MGEFHRLNTMGGVRGHVLLEILTVRFVSELGWPGSVEVTRSAVVWLLVRFVSVLFPGGI